MHAVPLFGPVMQLGFVVPDLEAAARHWTRLGVGPFFLLEHIQFAECRYKGTPTRFDMSVASAGQFFFWSGLCTAASQLAAPRLARRIGLLNTMVFTHIPASLCLIAAAFTPSLGLALGLLIIRSLLSQMDVPARSAFVMSVVTPSERAAAASFTLVPKSLASAAAPTIGGALFAAGLLAGDTEDERSLGATILSTRRLEELINKRGVAGAEQFDEHVGS